MQQTLSKIVVPVLLLLVIVPYAHGNAGVRSPATPNFDASLALALPAPPIVGFGPQLTPVKGTLHVLVIAAEFADINATVSISQLKQDWTGIVNQYYQEASYGTVSLQVDVYGWYRLPNSEAYYGRDCLAIDDADCSGSDTAWWVARDVVQLANNVNFANYDYYVFVHSGYGQESSGVKNDVWSVTFLGGVQVYAGGKYIDKFSVDPELEAKGATPIGVYAHEFAHQLGLPDLYNTQNGQTVMGPWTLMDAGLWNGNPPGSSPAHFDSWSKTQLGWITGSMLAVANSATVSNYTIDPTEVASSNIHAVQVPLPQSPSKYYLVEVRQKIGFDSALPSVGVLILYVDESLTNAKVRVIDANPSVSGLKAATWSVGQTFTDSLNNITIAVVGIANNAYRVRVGQPGAIQPQNENYVQFSIAKIFAQPNVITLPNTTVTIFIDITNQGTQNANNVPIEIDLDGNQYTTTSVSVNAASTAETSFTWQSAAGSHTFQVTIDPSNILNEPNRAGNVATFTLNVGPTLSINVPANLTSNGTSVWVKINEVQYNLTSTQLQTSVPSGTVTVQIESALNTSAGVRQAFMGWSDGVASNPRQLAISNNTQLTALFGTQYLLTVNANQGTTSPSGWYNASNTAVVTASVISNEVTNVTRLVFENWSGDYNSTSISLSVLMNKPVNIQANWIRQYYVSILSMTGSPVGAGWYNSGSSADVSVQPIVEFANGTRDVFTGWNVTRLVQAPTYEINVSSPLRLLALWKVQYFVQISSAYGTSSGSGWYDAGSTAPVTIQSQIDYSNRTRRMFTGWVGDYSGTASNFTLNVVKPMNIQAQWGTQYQISFKVSGIPNSTYVGLDLNNVSYQIAVNQPYTAWYNQGDILNPTTNQTVMGFFQFVNWRNSTSGPVSKPLTVTAPEDYTADYTATLPLGIPGFPVESVFVGVAAGLAAISLTRKRRRYGK